MTSKERDNMTIPIPSYSDRETLLRLGIVKVPIPSIIGKDQQQWASELSQVTPMIMAMQGDSEYAFYRNIMVEPELEFPLEQIVSEQIQEAFEKYFGVQPEEMRLDDAFCVHYNADQTDSSGKKHMDPSDITVNVCLENTDDVEGSQVLFYGSKKLENVDIDDNDNENQNEQERFLVPQEPGFATIHYGSHPHETTPLSSKTGRRTNVIVTYCYKDKTRSDVGKRNCYFI
ncbi:expressed unknown protein [Seminavis robusta]|uniref:Fe2OG dioxygenase domain-containing protein n=1 Tax=Seminavis robusta TaxID=568900 RepID=A0A9N8D8A1_9STRA|nr:expressed unknown protein [Seminavis robusta]|eukprot:Sro13_g010100.1 n/a (230) ;mRNA; f:119929-120618